MDHRLLYDGKLIDINVSGNEKLNLSTIRARCLYLDDNKTWNDHKTVVCEIKTNRASVKIIETRVCKELLTELLAPVLLVNISHKQGGSLYLMTLNLEREKIVPVRKINTRGDNPEHNNTGKCHFRIIDGPSLVWTTTTSLHYAGSTYTGCLQTTPAVICDLYNPEILWIGVKNNFIFFLIKDHSNDAAPRHTLFYKNDTDNNETTNNIRELNVSYFFPKEYTNIICTDITDFDFKKNEDDSLSSCSTSVLALTSKNFVLLFHNGQLMSAFPLLGGRSLIPNVKVEIFKWNPYSSNKVIAAIKNGTDVSIVDVCNKKVQCTWSNVVQCLCGDLVSLGSKQLLLLKEDYSAENGWILTDHNSILIDNSKPRTPQNKDAGSTDQGDNSSAAVDALQSRLHNELVVCCEKEREVERKQLFISNTWDRLQNVVKGRQLQKPVPDPTLVSLIGKKTSESNHFTVKPCTSTDNLIEKLLAVQNIWQRIVEDRWIVGVDFTSESATVSVKLSVIPVLSRNHNETLISLSQEVKFGSAIMLSHTNCRQTQDVTTTASNGQGNSKRRKTTCPETECPKSCNGSMLCILKLPRFVHHTDFRCHLVVDWTESSTTEDLEVTHPCSSVGRHAFNCGMVTLSVDDVLRGKHHVKMLKDIDKNKENQREATAFNAVDISRDITALNLAQIHTTLKVVSACSDVSHLGEWLEERAGFRLSSVYNCHVACHSGALCGSRIVIDNGLKQSKDYMKFTLYTRDQDQAVLMVHHLYSSFPDDVLILPDKHSKQSKVLRTLAARLEEEITFLTSFIRELSKGHNSQTSGGFLTSCEDEKNEKGVVNVDKVRENFFKRKQDMLETTSLDCDEQKIVKLKKVLDKLQKSTDEEITKLKLI